MKKEEAIRIISSCAKTYCSELKNQNILIVFGKGQEYEFIETAFLPQSFLHLTGVELVKKEKEGEISESRSSDFLNKCQKGQLSPKEFNLAANGTTEMKLRVLPQLMNIHRTARMVGDYNHTKTVLKTDKLAGNVTGCIGFIKSKNRYYPNTALREDIRDVTENPTKKIYAILRKPIGSNLYKEVTYLAKDTTIELLQSIKGLLDLIDFSAEEIAAIKKGEKAS